MKASHVIGKKLDEASALEDLVPVYNAARHMANLFDQNNPIAAIHRSKQSGFVLACEIAGGTAAGAFTGSVTANPAAAGMVGLAASQASGKLCSAAAERFDQSLIYKQTDSKGIDWSFNGQYWHTEAKVDSSDDGRHNPKTMFITANLETTHELNRLVADSSSALGMADLPKPQNPFVQPAREGEPQGLKPASWIRRGADWELDIVTGYTGLEGNTPILETYRASKERSDELDRDAALTVASNIINGSVGIAMEYDQVSKQLGFERFGLPPEHINSALLEHGTVLASDNRVYIRQQENVWLTQSHKDRDETVKAEGNLLLELELTYDARLQARQKHLQQMETIQAYTPPSAQQANLASIEMVYRNSGNAPLLENLEATALALERTRKELGYVTTGLHLLPDKYGQYTVDSPIQHYVYKHDGSLAEVGITSYEELVQARQQLKGLEPGLTTLSTVNVTPDDPAPENELPANHQDAALYRYLCNQLPVQMDSAKSMELLLTTRQAGIDHPDKVSSILNTDQRIFVCGNYPGCRASIDLDSPPPPPEQTLQALLELSQRERENNDQQQKIQACPGNAPSL